MFPHRRRQQDPERRFWLELITAESDASRFVRYRRLIRFPQLTMPLIAALTPPHWKVTHTDEIVQEVRFDLPCDLVGITANTPAHDDRGIFERTVDTFRSIAVDSATVSVLIPFPNTPLFDRLERQGRILTYDWEKYNGKKDVVFQPARMTPHELLMGSEWAARQFYSLTSIAERMWKSRTGLWWNLPRNLGYHLALRNFGMVGYNPALI